MFLLIICIILLLVGQGMIINFTIKENNSIFESVFTSLIYWMVGLFVSFVICAVFIPMTGGLMRGYGEGIREGYITKISDKGVIWKTYEAQIQVGTGEMAALQKPFEFSIPKNNKELYNSIKENIGKKVNIEYTQWLLMPYQIGDSDIELTKVTIKEK